MHGAKWVHGHETQDALDVAHRAELREKHRRFPGRYPKAEPHTVTTPMTVYANHGRWLIDCSCGNGVAVEPGWVGRCFSCGAVYSSLVYPSTRSEIEAVLDVRPEMHRNWRSPETLTTLKRENVEHNIKVTNGVDRT